jgi:hypothetical protein
MQPLSQTAGSSPVCPCHSPGVHLSACNRHFPPVTPFHVSNPGPYEQGICESARWKNRVRYWLSERSLVFTGTSDNRSASCGDPHSRNIELGESLWLGGRPELQSPRIGPRIPEEWPWLGNVTSISGHTLQAGCVTSRPDARFIRYRGPALWTLLRRIRMNG